MQTLNLNLSLQINIGTDGKAEVAVLSNETTAAPAANYHDTASNTAQTVVVPDATKSAEKVAQVPPPPPVVNAESVAVPTAVQPPAETAAPRQLRTDFDIAALTKKYVSNPVINNPTNEEFERIYAETGITPEDWYNHPDYKTWIAPKQSIIEIPKKGIDLDSDDDGDTDFVPSDELPPRPAPKPRGSIREEAMRLYGENYPAIANTIEQLEH